MSDLASQLRQALFGAGAALVGFADMGQVPPAARQGLPRAVSIIVARDPLVVAALSDGPIAECHDEYRRNNELLSRLRDLATGVLREHGHQAIPRSALQQDLDVTTLSTLLPHKTAATRAGLGWIGRCAVLVTEAYGPAVRLTSVLTDAPLPTGTPLDESRCGDCRACVDACPGKAVKGQDWHLGLPREALLDAQLCDATGTAHSAELGLSRNHCAYCVAACPKAIAYLRRSGALR